MIMKNNELKQIAQAALKSEYGFAPAKNQITLLEANENGTYIMFEVNGKVYKFNSHISTYGDMSTVFAGAGTISRCDENGFRLY